nr:uncharacterized protein LOC105347749 isoform X2 [Crassostrea gigas]XP_034331195.1 uncharacterized protein LOC105347749 isoform X2 [Crassostrea gigas]
MMRSTLKVIASRFALSPLPATRDILGCSIYTGKKSFYWNAVGQVPDSKTPVYCMQFDVSDLEEHDVTSFTTTLQNDVSSLKPDIVYIQQTKQSVPLEEIGLRMKGLGYEGYEQRITPELKQATYFRSNLLRGLYGSPVVTNAATTG